jgi:hypothetical protein
MNDEHLDDELLSAHLDGEAPDAAEHLAECGACRARMAELESAAALVGGPPPAMDDRARAAALAVAMDAWQEGDTSGTRSGRRQPWLLAVAAVAAGLVVSVAVVRHNAHDHRSTLASDASGSVTATAALDGGDLGDQSDTSALAGVVRGALGGTRPAAPALGESGSAAGGSAAGGPTADRAAPFAATSGSPAQGAATTTTAIPSSAPVARAVRRSCLPTVTQNYGAGLGPLAYTATLRWQGAPAELLAYRLAQPGKNLTIRVFVMAQKDCQLLVVQSL